MELALSLDLIQKLSRSFSLSLLAVPKQNREAVATAYMLARYADTITDSGSLSVEDRVLFLKEWQSEIQSKSLEASRYRLDSAKISPLADFNAEEAELLRLGPRLISSLRGLKVEERQHIQKVLEQLTEAMIWDLKVFRNDLTYGCPTKEDFDRYCYMIAGCVGEFWTRIFGFSSALEMKSIRYGKALQRINILRDVREDWSRNRIYLPLEDLKAKNFNLQQPVWEQTESWNSFCEDYLAETRDLLKDGFEYCNRIPKHQWRIRWASIMPARIGAATIDKLSDASAFNREFKLKISRPRVRKLAILSLFETIFFRNYR